MTTMNHSDQAMDWQPMTLTPRPWKFVGLLVISLVLAGGGWLIAANGNTFGWLALLFFGLCAVVAIILLLPGAAWLRLDRKGFTVCSLYRAHTTPWRDVDQFAVGSNAAGRTVVYQFAPSYNQQQGGRAIARGLSGYEAALPDTYGMNADDLAALLNSWKARADKEQYQ